MVSQAYYNCPLLSAAICRCARKHLFHYLSDYKISGHPHCCYEGPWYYYVDCRTVFAVDLFLLIYLVRNVLAMDGTLTSESLLSNDDLLFQHLLGHCYASYAELLN